MASFVDNIPEILCKVCTPVNFNQCEFELSRDGQIDPYHAILHSAVQH